MMPLESQRGSARSPHPHRVGNLVEIARNLSRQGRHHAADVLFEAAMAADPTLEAELAFAESLCHREEFQAAVGHFLSVLSHRSANEAPQEVAAICNNLAACYRGLGEFERAAAWQQQSIRYAEHDDSGAFACDLTNRACDAIAGGDYALAERLLIQSLSIERSRGALAEQAADLGNLGIVSLLTGRSAEARRLLWQAYRLHRRLDDAYGCACDLVHLAELWSRRGHSDRERACLERAHALLVRLEAQVSLQRIRARLDSLRRELGSRCATSLPDVAGS